MPHRSALPRRVVMAMLGAGLPLANNSQSEAAPETTARDDILTALDNSLWIPDGDNAQRQIYVLAAPWCPYCKMFYKASRGLSNIVQFRWIEAGEIDLLSAYQIREAGLTRNPSLLPKFHGTPGKAPPSNPNDSMIGVNASRYAFGITRLIGRINATGPVTSTGFPTIACQTSIGLSVASGVPQNFADLVASVVPRSYAANIHPSGTDLIKLQFSSRPITPTPYYAIENNPLVFCLPDAKSPIIAAPKKNSGYPAVSVTSIQGERWLELKAFGGAGVYTGFGRGRDFSA